MQTSQLQPLGWALLMRHKDANQSVKLLMRHSARRHLTKKRGAGFQQAAQYTEQSNQPDVPVYAAKAAQSPEQSNQAVVYREQKYIFTARQASADALEGCKPALVQEVRHWLPKSSSES